MNLSNLNYPCIQQYHILLSDYVNVTAPADQQDGTYTCTHSYGDTKYKDTVELKFSCNKLIKSIV